MALLDRLSRKMIHREAGLSPESQFGFAEPTDTKQEIAYQGLKEQIHHRIVDEMPNGLQAWEEQNLAEVEIRGRIIELCNRIIDENPFAVPRGSREKIVMEITAEILGLGPLEALLRDNTVTEVMVNGAKQIYVERYGRILKTDITFRDEAHLLHIIDRIVSPIGRRIDESSPMVDARLKDGSRVNVIIPPLSLSGPCVTIRKFSQDPFTVKDLIGFGSLTQTMADFIQACVQGRLNILVSGGTGSGKTTLLNVLSSFIPTTDRVVTLEDAAELQLRQEHVVTLETRPANIEGQGAVTMRDLVRNALRMRPDRIIVGEVRTGETLDMLQAMNTGHDGSMTTAHANTPRDLLSRLETMVLMSGLDLPVKAIRSQISAGIDLIIHISRMRDGSRKVLNITEVGGMEGDVIILQDLFYFEQTGSDDMGRVQGIYKCTGIRPKFQEKLAINGVKINTDMFLG